MSTTSVFPARIFETASRTATPLEVAEELVDELLDQPARAMRLTKELIDLPLSFEEYCERTIEYLGSI
ncbi:hypothetical protein ACFQGT_18485 [Natrialbaceae archaeon GCM10025810]|uniref:hypothetical protein n=1 Tax=Halovalidus salilacus TaxID=3075124 RepID=UPI003621F729